tara:strand:- start:35 stop:376 length:342 start_codon:yes stop_codon:yes gene_type:complete
MNTIDIGTIVTEYGLCSLRAIRAITDTYSKGNALSVRLEATDDGYWSPYATLSIDLPEHEHMLDENEFFVKLWSENSELVELLNITDVFTDTGKSVLHGFNNVPVWKLNVPTD